MIKMADDEYKHNNISFDEIQNSVLVDLLVLPNRTYIKTMYHLDDIQLPILTDKEQNSMKKRQMKYNENKELVPIPGKYMFANLKFIYELLSNSISTEETINDFLPKLNQDNWEGIFYTALLSQYGFEISGTLLETNRPEFFYDLIMNNPYRFKQVEIKTAEDRDNIRLHRVMLRTLYKCKIAQYCSLPSTLLGYYSKILEPAMASMIVNYLPSYKLVDWIDESKLIWKYLSTNKYAIDLLKLDIDNISWVDLSKNENSDAIDLLNLNPDSIYWHYLSGNPNTNVIKILQQYPDKIDWRLLSGNPNPDAVKLLLEHPNNINYLWLSSNTNSDAINFLINNRSKHINYEILAGNPNPLAVEYLLKHINNLYDNSELFNNPNQQIVDYILNPDNKVEIKWNWVSANTNPNILHILYHEHFNEIDWERFSENPNAIVYLQNHLELVSWRGICKNPNAGEIIRQNIDNPERIFWSLLSENPCIFEPIKNIKLEKFISQW